MFPFFEAQTREVTTRLHYIQDQGFSTFRENKGMAEKLKWNMFIKSPSRCALLSKFYLFIYLFIYIFHHFDVALTVIWDITLTTFIFFAYVL